MGISGKGFVRMIIMMDIIVGFCWLLFLAAPPGYLISKALFLDWCRPEYVIPFCAVAIMLGLVVDITIWWTVGLVSFNFITLLIVPVVSLGAILVHNREHLGRSAVASKLRSCRTKPNAFFLALSLVSFGYIVFTTLTLAWAEPGDPWAHSVFATMIVQNGRIPTTLLPLLDEALYYPVGYHTMPAALSLLAGMPPGKGLLIVASFSVAFMPIAVAWWSYIRTESYKASLMSFLFTYFYSYLGVEYSLWGYYFNGTYTVITAVFIPVLALLAIDASTRQPKKINLKTVSFLIFSCYAALITYPVFILIPGLLILIPLVQKLSFLRNGIPRLRLRMPSKPEALFAAFSTMIASFVVFLYFCTDYLYFIQLLFINTGQESQAAQLHNYYVQPAYFFDPFVILVSVSLLAATLLGLRQNRKSPFYIALCIIQVGWYLSIIPAIHDSILFILQPQRFLLVVSIVSFALTPQVFRDLKQSRYMKSEKWNRTVITRHGITRIETLFIVTVVTSFIFISPSLLYQFSGHYAIRAATFQNSETWKNDAAGIRWLVENTDKHDLILNFQTYSDLFMPSFGLLNVVYARPSNESLGLALYRVWNSTQNETLVYSLLKEYGIHYVYLAGFWAMVDVVNHVYRAEPRPYNAQNYTSFFDSYSFLTLRFQQGACRVYEVVIPEAVEQA